MKKHYSISLYLDTRREKENNKYPLKLRVYANQLGKQNLYPTKFEFSKEEFENIWESKKTRENYKQSKLKLQAIENRANEVAELIVPFSFDKFEKKLYLKAGQGEDVFFQYQSIINVNKKLGRIGNANIYELSMNSLKNFLEFSTGKEQSKLRFTEITPFWLNSYENYMINDKERSRTTVSIYLRSLRSVFNSAISENEILPEIYPFGKNKYQIPAVKKVKKALSKDQIKLLFEAKPQTPEQEKAKDFWFFSYACNGMNLKDIAMLKYEDIYDNKLIYYRAKTINTAKADLKPITIYINEFSLSMIEKYGNSDKTPKNFIFSIVNNTQSNMDKYKRIKNFTRFINQNLKKLAISVNLPSDISTYWARHTFSTMAIRNGASIEFVSEALNHSNLKTTQNYIAGFEDDVKKDFSNNLMNF